MNANEEEEWRSEIDSLQALSQIEKERSKKALTEIKEILGTSIPSLVEQKHPITRYVFGPNHAPWTWKWLIALVEAVQLVSNQINGLKVINKLKDGSTFDEALFQIYIAKCIIGELSIEFLREDDKNKIADWKITDSVTKDELLVELTELRNETSDDKESRLAFEKIVERIRKNCNSGGRPNLFYRGRLFKPYISRPTLQQIFKKIDSTMSEARRNGFAELTERNTISLAIATVDKKHLLLPWTIEKNVLSQTEADRECSDSSFEGLPYPINEVKRIKYKIEKKKRQFDRKAINALVIRANRLFLPAYIEQYIDILEQVVFDHDYLGILIVVGGHVGGLAINSRKEGEAHLYLIRSVDLITKEILILANIHSMDNMKTLNFSSKIKNAFESCKTLLF